MNPLHQAAITLILTALIVTLCYTAACAIRPFTACPRCDGTGKRRTPTGWSWRHCHRCHGTGAQLRLGRRLWNHYRRTRTR